MPAPQRSTSPSSRRSRPTPSIEPVDVGQPDLAGRADLVGEGGKTCWCRRQYRARGLALVAAGFDRSIDARCRSTDIRASFITSYLLATEWKTLGHLLCLFRFLHGLVPKMGRGFAHWLAIPALRKIPVVLTKTASSLICRWQPRTKEYATCASAQADRDLSWLKGPVFRRG